MHRNKNITSKTYSNGNLRITGNKNIRRLNRATRRIIRTLLRCTY